MHVILFCIFYRDHKGGPNGGDGGTGGDVIFVADQSYSQFAHLNHQCRAKNGGNGAKKNRHGKNGDDLIIQVYFILFFYFYFI